MTSEILVRYIHLISIFTLVASLTGEYLLVKKTMRRSELGRLVTLDSIYGFSAMTAVAAGLTLWFWVGKPADFYTQNWIFLLKISLVGVMAILSIWPTLYYVKNRKKKDQPDEELTLPNYVFLLLKIQIALLLLIPLCAVFMAKGIGYAPG